jgi:predicted MFS family arabinose efflux permease
MGLIVTLMMVYAFNYLDRGLLSVLGEPIKRELGLSDTQLGLGGGVAFSLVYSLAAFPIARIADRGLYREVLLASVLVWCSLTMAGGLVDSLLLLIITRMGVAVGEAGVVPTAQALVSKQISPDFRARSLSLLGIGGAIGSFASPTLGGWAYSEFGWRGAFFVIGPIGLLLIPALLWGVKREKRDADAKAAPPSVGLVRSLRTLFSIRHYPVLWISSALIFTAPGAYGGFAGSFFIRTYDFSVASAGQIIGLAMGGGTAAGIFLGGYLYDRFSKGTLGSGLIYPSIASLMSGVIGMIGWMGGHPTLSAVCFGISFLLYAVVNAPLYATALSLAPADMRSTSVAVFNASLLLLGGSMGPLLVGSVSDALRPMLGNYSLGPALSVVTCVQIVGSLMLLRVCFKLRQDQRPPRAAPAAA